MGRSRIRRLLIPGLLALAWALGLAACRGDGLPAGLAGGAPRATALLPATLVLPATVLPATATTPAPARTAPAIPLPTTAPPPSPSPSPTLAPSLRQLTTGGCCVGPSWLPGGEAVLFIDRPTAGGPAGLWSVNLEGGSPQLFSERLGLYSPDMQMLAYPQGGQTIVERLADGERWTIPSEGRAASFSPDAAYVAWTVGPSGPPFDTPRRQVWISLSDGSQARSVMTVYGGGFAGWLTNSTLLVSGRIEPGEALSSYWAVGLEGGEPFEITRASRLCGALPSPDGAWLAYQVTFDPNPDENGLWLANTHAGEKVRLNLFGSYRWRDAGHLLVIPLDMSRTIHSLWEFDVSGGSQPLADPGVTPFRVANGDWAVSPDGENIVFVSAEDHNLWLLTLTTR